MQLSTATYTGETEVLTAPPYYRATSFDYATIISSDSVQFKPMRVTLRWRELTWCASVKKRFWKSISRFHAVLRIHSFFPCPYYAQCLYNTSVSSSRKFGQMRSACVTTVTGTTTLTHPHVWRNAGKALEKKESEHFKVYEDDAKKNLKHTQTQRAHPIWTTHAHV